jgi:uncharacterized membrane protein (DUF2068 family)
VLRAIRPSARRDSQRSIVLKCLSGQAKVGNWMDKTEDFNSVPDKSALKAIALFEIIKGMAVVAIAVVFLSISPAMVKRFAEYLTSVFHSPFEIRWITASLAAYENLNGNNIWLLASAVVAYVSLRFIEGYGLWHERPWAEWLGVFSGGLFIPFELIELYREFTLLRILITAFNIALVLFLLWHRLRKTAEHAHE